MSCKTIPFLNLQITISDIRPHIKWAVSLVTAYGHFHLPQGFVWVCMGQYTHFTTPKGSSFLHIQANEIPWLFSDNKFYRCSLIITKNKFLTVPQLWVKFPLSWTKLKFPGLFWLWKNISFQGLFTWTCFSTSVLLLFVTWMACFLIHCNFITNLVDMGKLKNQRPRNGLTDPFDQYRKSLFLQKISVLTSLCGMLSDLP